jgi:hypothetical protein
MHLNTLTQYYNYQLHVGSPDKSGRLLPPQAGGYHTIKILNGIDDSSKLA